MAVTKTIIISAETKTAQAAVDQLTEQLKIQDQVIKKLTQDQAFYEAKLASASKTNFAAQAHYNKKLKETNTELTNEIKARRTLTGEQAKATKEVNRSTKAVKKSHGVMGVLNKLTGGAAGAMLNYVMTIRQAVVGMKVLKVAMIGTGIGAIVVAVASLAAAFSTSEIMQDKFAVGSAVLGAIWTRMVDQLATVGEMLINVLMKPRESWDAFVDALVDGVEFLKRQSIDRLIAYMTVMAGKIVGSVLKMRIAWNKWTGDAKEARQLERQLKRVNDKVRESQKVIAAANKELTDGFKKLYDLHNQSMMQMVTHMAAQGVAVKIRNVAHKIERQLQIDRAKADRKINEIRLKAEDRVNLSATQRIALLRQAQAIEADITKKEMYAQGLRIKAQILSMSTTRDSIKDKDKLAKMEAALIKLETKKLRSQRLLQTQITTALNEEKAIANKKIADAKIITDAAELREKERLQGIKDINDQFYENVKTENAIREEDRIRLEKERALAELDALDATEVQKLNIRTFYDNKIKKAQEDADDQKEADDKIVQETKLQQAKETFQGIATMLGENSKAGKAAAAAAALINTYQGITAELATKTVTPFEIGLKIANVATIAGIGFKAVKQILKTDTKSVSSAGGATAIRAAAPTAQAPSFNIVGQGQGNQIAAAIGQQEQAPVQAFVVSQDVTTAQSLENGIIQGATLGD